MPSLLKTALSTLFLMVICLSPAHAGLITFNLAGDSGDGAEGALLDGLSSANITKAGVTASFIAASPNSSPVGLLLNQTTSAFGINRDGDGCDVSGQFDSNCGDEGVIIAFDRLVTLVSLTLTLYSPSDDATLEFENFTTDLIFGSDDLPSTPSTFDIGAPVGSFGDRFAIGSFAGNGFSLDRFTIQTVPAPTTLALFGLGLLGLSRRRKA